MAIVIQSKTDAGSYVNGNVTITKPTGVAIGDLLITILNVLNATPSTLSGWTLITTKVSTSGTDHRISAYYRTATSDDVSATNYVWTSNSTLATGGMFRITGHHSTVPLVVFNSSADNTGPLLDFAETVTPTNLNSLLISIIGAYATSNSSGQATDITLATSNPTWTTQWYQNNASTSSISHTVSTAIRPEKTATGNLTATYGGFNTYIGVLLVVRPAVSADVLETVNSSEVNKKGINKVISQIINTSEIIVNFKNRIWNKLTKPTTIWTNKSK